MRRKPQTTRRRLLALAGAGAATGLAGCLDGLGGGNGNGNGNGGQDPADLPPVHFITDYNNETWQAYWEENLIPQFNEETDIKVDIEYSGFSGGGQEGRLATLLQSGDPPALSTGTTEQVGDVWAGGQLLNTTEIVENIESTAGELMSTPYRDYDGEVFQIPHGYYTSLFMYRTDVYEELGLEVPETWAQLRENARVIDESDLDIRGYGLAGTKAGKSQDEFQVYLAHAGAAELRPEDPNAEKPVAEMWFPEEETLAVLDLFDELADYSTDPSSIGWGSSIKGWLSGNYAQQYHLNAWPAGIAAAAGIPEVAENTDVAPLPVWDEGGITHDDVWFGEPTPDGHFRYKGADNVPGAIEFMEWCYADNMERTANMYSSEPSRFLPNYADVLSSDTFQNISLFQEFPEQLELLEKVQNEVMPTMYGNVEEALVDFPEAVYFYRFFFQGEMVNQVVVANEDPQAAYEEAYEQAEKRLAEAKEKVVPDDAG